MTRPALPATPHQVALRWTGFLTWDDRKISDNGLVTEVSDTDAPRNVSDILYAEERRGERFATVRGARSLRSSTRSGSAKAMMSRRCSTVIELIPASSGTSLQSESHKRDRLPTLSRLLLDTMFRVDADLRITLEGAVDDNEVSGRDHHR